MTRFLRHGGCILLVCTCACYVWVRVTRGRVLRVSAWSLRICVYIIYMRVCVYLGVCVGWCFVNESVYMRECVYVYVSVNVFIRFCVWLFACVMVNRKRGTEKGSLAVRVWGCGWI